MKEQQAKIIGIVRYRLSTDGDGVTTLVALDLSVGEGGKR